MRAPSDGNPSPSLREQLLLGVTATLASALTHLRLNRTVLLEGLAALATALTCVFILQNLTHNRESAAGAKAKSFGARCERGLQCNVTALKQKRVALCLYGTISRSIAATWPHMDKKLVMPLTEGGHIVDIYGFGMELGSDDLLDGVLVNQSVVRLVRCRTSATRACSRPTSTDPSMHAVPTRRPAGSSFQTLRQIGRCPYGPDWSERSHLATLFDSSTANTASAVFSALRRALNTPRLSS